MASASLTAAERETLNAAERIIKERFQHSEETLMFSWHGNFRGGFSTTYFTPNKVQHGSLWVADSENALADKIDRALELRADEEGRADQIKAERVETLRKELAALTGEPSIAEAA